MSSKRQFLDPIGAGCRLILLHFYSPGTKIRINDHTIQLVGNIYAERIFFRPWVFGDSREDMSALYPMIVRFIELYLVRNTPEVKRSEPVHDTVQQFNFLEHQSIDNDINFEANVAEKSIGKNTEKYDKYLKKLASYMIKGLKKLGNTYGMCNATFTLQFYCNLLKAGIDGTYTQDLLPEKFADHDMLNSEKIRTLWSDDDIVEVAELFEKSFNAFEKNNTQMVNAYGAAISTLLNEHDEKFKIMMLSTDCA